MGLEDRDEDPKKHGHWSMGEIGAPA